MKELPYDIVFQIVQELKLLHDPPGMEHHTPWARSILYPMKFAPYATLNRAWNIATERESFQDLIVYSDDIPEHLRGPLTTTRFKQMMSRDPARRRAIPRDIIFCASIQSPLDSEEASTEEGRNANDCMFSASVRQFWEVLEEWPPVPDHKCLKLELRHIVIAPEKLVETTDDDDGKAVKKRRRDEMYLNLPGGPLPRLRCISYFGLSDSIRSNLPRLWPPALFNILNSFQGLGNAFLNLLDIAVTEQRLWTDYREGADQQSLTPAFARMNMLMPLVNLILELSSAISVLPNTIVNLVANFNYISRGYSNWPSYTSLPYDPLSISLRDISTRLVFLTLMDIRTTPALFWPGTNEPASTPQPYWPHLLSFSLWFAPLDPCEFSSTVYLQFGRVLTAHQTGNWYVEAPGEYDEDIIIHVPALFDPSDYIFRTPREEHINPLLAAVGHAVRRMPRLNDMDIRMGVQYEDVKMRGNLEEADLSLRVRRVVAAEDEEGSALALFWESKPPVPWAAETISAWGMERYAALLKLDEDEAPRGVELQARLLL